MAEWSETYGNDRQQGNIVDTGGRFLYGMGRIYHRKEYRIDTLCSHTPDMEDVGI